MNTKPCTCGKIMILVPRSIANLSYPIQIQETWVCHGCGNTEEGPVHRAETNEEIERRAWEQAQRKTTWVGAYRTKYKTLYWTGHQTVSLDNFGFVLTNNINEAKHFNTELEALKAMAMAGFYPRPEEEYQVEEHEILT